MENQHVYKQNQHTYRFAVVSKELYLYLGSAQL